MATISHILGFDLGSLNEVYQQNGTGTVSAQSSVVRNGGYALKCDSTTSNPAYVTLAQFAAAGTKRAVYQAVSFYIQVSTTPGIGAMDIVSIPSTNAYAIRVDYSNNIFKIMSNGVIDTSGSVPIPDLTTGWHRIDVDASYNAGAGIRCYCDGVLMVNNDTLAFALATTLQLGVVTNITGTITVYYDDVVCYTTALPAVLADYNVSLLRPVSDNTRGGWTTGAGGTTNLWDALNNTPPTGTVTGSQSATSTIKNAVSSATDNYDANCAAYNTITGLADSSQILGVQAVCNDAQEVTTNSPKTGAVVIASNPGPGTDHNFEYGLPNGLFGSGSAAAVGAFPVGWGTHWGEVRNSPSVTISAGPVARVGKRTATTRVVDVDALGVYVAWTPAVHSLVYDERRVRRNSLLRR